MAAVRHARPGAALQLVHRPLHLPPEIWSLVVRHLDDFCFAWFILRRVSPFLRQITEDVFAQYILHHSSIRFTGQLARDMLADTWELNEYGEASSGGGDIGHWDLETISSLQDHYPTFLFKISEFSHAKTKERAVLKLRDEPTDYEVRGDDYVVNVDWTHQATYSYTFYLRRQCCICVPRIQSTADVARCNCLAKAFFRTPRDQNDRINRLESEACLVHLNGQLKSIRIPSMKIDVSAQELSIDWRLLCQRFYLNELKCRRATKPWIRYLSVDWTFDEVRVHTTGDAQHYDSWPKSLLLDEMKRHGWLFWDKTPNNPTSPNAWRPLSLQDNIGQRWA